MATPHTIPAPVDSDEHPVSVLLQSRDDIDASYCDQCQRPASDWPASSFDSRPGAMYRAALYCSGCVPASYDPETGTLVSTLTGIDIPAR